MGGGLMQLVAYGAQDIYLTGNPQITFFKVVYRRHTNFAMEAIEQTFNGSADFGNRVTCTISRNGDLVKNMWLQATLPATVASTGSGSVWASNVGHRLINTAEVEIGGQKIDKHYGDWLEIWSQLTVPSEKTTGYDTMTDHTDNDTVAYGAYASGVATDTGIAVPTSGNATFTNATNAATDIGIGAYSITVTGDGSAVMTSSSSETFAGSAIDDITASERDTTAGVVTLTLKGTTSAANQQLKTTVAGATNATIILTKSGSNIFIEFDGAVTGDVSGVVAAKQLFVPLQFWFCRNPGLALPLIALQYHEVKINLEFNSFATCKSTVMGTSSAALSSVSLWVDYIYLDTDERRRFAQVSHEYLIEQLQFTGDESVTGTSASLRLNFNHPVKEIVWVGTTATQGVYDANLSNAKLQLNGHDRFAQRNNLYFNKVQPFQHHTNIPSGNVYLYSFALKPEEHQPSGTCNFSRIDNATLQMTWSSAPAGSVVKVFAVNYNVLRVMSGMGGLAYSN